MLYGTVKYISKRGLGAECDIELYIKDSHLYVLSIRGSKVDVEWIEKGVSVRPID